MEIHPWEIQSLSVQSIEDWCGDQNSAHHEERVHPNMKRCKESGNRRLKFFSELFSIGTEVSKLNKSSMTKNDKHQRDSSDAIQAIDRVLWLWLCDVKKLFTVRVHRESDVEFVGFLTFSSHQDIINCARYQQNSENCKNNSENFKPRGQDFVTEKNSKLTWRWYRWRWTQLHHWWHTLFQVLEDSIAITVDWKTLWLYQQNKKPERKYHEIAIIDVCSRDNHWKFKNLLTNSDY
jgi:hypothetical protein